MVRKVTIIYLFNTLMLLLFSSLSVAGEEPEIIRGITENTITIIGEQHGHPESIKFFQSLIKGYLKKDSCLTVALEIANNQQPIIEKIMQGRAVASDIEISSVIDHAALRNMIDSLAKLKRNGACLNLIAIDSLKGNRDKFMAAQLIKNVGATPILALLGGLHSLKKVNWDLSMTKGHSYVAEILNKHSINVRSYQQIWIDSECDNPKKLAYSFVDSKSNEAAKLINEHFISMMNAYEFNSAIDVADGVIVWEC